MIVKYTTLRRFRIPITIIGIGYITWFFLLPRYADRKHAESLRFRHSGQFQQALKCMNAAILLDSKKENYHWARALTYWLMYKEDRTNTDFLRRAKTDWLKAIDLKQGDENWSGWSEVFFGLAQVEYRLGEVKQGVINYKKAFEYSVDPARRATIASILGYIYFISKDYSEAVIWLDRVPVRSLENPDPAVAEYAETLLEKIKQARLFKAVSDDEGLELKNSDGDEDDEV